MYIFRLHVNLRYQLFIQPVIAALCRGRGRIVFINAEDLHICERDVAGLMASDEFTIQRYRRRTCGKTEPERPITSIDCTDYHIRKIGACNILIFKDLSRYPFIAVKDTFR